MTSAVSDLWWSLCCARTAGHCKTDEASPWCRGWPGSPDAGISRPSSVPVGPARHSRQGSDYQFTLVRGSARQHINSDPRPTTQKLTPWDSLPATDTRGGGGDQLWGIKIDISTAEEQLGDHWEMIFLWIQSLWGIRGERRNTSARLSDNAELLTRPVNALTLCQLKCK